MDTLTIEPDFFGGATQSFSPTKRLGSDASRLSQIQDGKWKTVSDYFGSTAKPAAAPAAKAPAKK
jgi:branched-chain amino acid transport system substrate-binding protein